MACCRCYHGKLVWKDRVCVHYCMYNVYYKLIKNSSNFKKGYIGMANMHKKQRDKIGMARS